ncbi:RPA-interacting protein A [Trichoplax sp. H2]|nr:RPA-interacting protein A [Trichoplax sp. H2]|eukprot:RDD38034.1 RPA-interacting protein A [Trichoplax sp. H2]
MQMATTHRQGVKKRASWREIFRSRCRDRLKESRHKAINELRSKSENFKNTYIDSCQSLVEDVMYQEWEKIKKEDNKLPSLVLRNTAPIPYTQKQENFDKVEHVLSVLEEMEEELIKEERKLLQSVVDDYFKFDMTSLSAVIERMEGNEIICPVCLRSPLLQNKHIIFCSCGLRLDTEFDGITLDYVKKQIEDAFNMHNKSCFAKPTMSEVKIPTCKSNNLLLTCNECDFLYLVL